MAAVARRDVTDQARVASWHRAQCHVKYLLSWRMAARSNTPIDICKCQAPGGGFWWPKIVFSDNQISRFFVRGNLIKIVSWVAIVAELMWVFRISLTQVLISQTRGILNIQLFLAQFTRRHFSSDYPINCCQIFLSIKTRVRESGPKLAGIMPAEEFICGARIGVTTLKLKRK